jgi:hypothetical protein
VPLPFLQLVKLDEDHSGTVTRRRATYGDISEAAQSVVQKLAERDARLIVKGRDEASEEETIEVSHEALIQNWPTLKEWVNQDRAFLLWHQRLRSDLEDWEKNQRTSNYLLTGGPLAEAERWLTERPEELNTDEKLFIQESVKQRAQVELEENYRQNELFYSKRTLN